MGTRTVAILMRTKNSGWILAQTLQALFSQSFRDFHLYIVDSGSTDNTLEIAKKFPCDIRSIPSEEYLPGAVLNESIAKISSDLIVFLNSDTVLLSPKSLQTLIAPFNDKNVAATFGRQLTRPDAHLWVQRDYKDSFPNKKNTPPWIPLSLCVSAIRREKWEEHPFQTITWGSEDIEWGKWANESGYTVQYVKEATAMHSHNYTLKQLWARRVIEGEADALIWNKKEGMIASIGKGIKRVIQDTLFSLKNRHLPLTSLPYRIAESYGYYFGIQLGRKRKGSRDHSPKSGQSVILENYGNK